MNTLALLEHRQSAFVGMLKGLMRNHSLIKKDTTTHMVSEAHMLVRGLAKKGKVIDAIVCCDNKFLSKLVERDFGVGVKTEKDKLLHLYAGAIFWLFPTNKAHDGHRNIYK